jgi:small-conductance mechanosensitive channel
MIETLRAEEQSDIKHRDDCEREEAALKAAQEALSHGKKNADAEKERQKAKKQKQEDDIKAAKQEIKDQKKALADALDNRNTENADYIQARKDDQEAVKLLVKARGQIAAFYANNKALVQKQPEENKAPETWSKPYGGRKSESTGVFAILEMIKEDIEKEIGDSDFLPPYGLSPNVSGALSGSSL